MSRAGGRTRGPGRLPYTPFCLLVFHHQLQPVAGACSTAAYCTVSTLHPVKSAPQPHHTQLIIIIVFIFDSNNISHTILVVQSEGCQRSYYTFKKRCVVVEEWLWCDVCNTKVQEMLQLDSNVSRVSQESLAFSFTHSCLF